MTTKFFATIALALAVNIGFAQTQTNQKQDETTIAHFVDQQAQPKLGQKELQTYMSQHIKYPKKAIKEHIQGIVSYQYIVDKNGKMTDIKILRDIGGGCGDVVKKALESYTGGWVPAKSKGVSVKSYFTGTFDFKL